MEVTSEAVRIVMRRMVVLILLVGYEKRKIVPGLKLGGFRLGGKVGRL